MNELGRYVICFGVLAIFMANAMGQDVPLAIGQWRSWLPYQSARYVTQSEQKVWFATELSLMSVNKIDKSINYLSKVEGLSQVGVHLVKYHKGAQVLIVVYEGGSIDLLSDTQILTVSSLEESNVIIGDKRVNDVYCEQGGSRAWLAGNFGISRLDVITGLFEGTTRMPIEARSLTIWRDSVWVATQEGVYAAPLSGVNLDDFSNWRWLGPEAGFPADYAAGAMTVFSDRLYLSIDGALAYYDGNGQVVNVYQENGMYLHFLTAEGQRLLAGFRCVDDCNGRLLYFQADGSFKPSAAQCVNRPLYAIEDEQGRVWIADEWRRFRVDEGNTSCNLFDTNTPWSANTYDIELWQDEVWIAAGGVSSIFGYLFRPDGILAYVDGQWRAYNKFTRDELAGLEDFLSLRIHPEKGVVYAGSFLDGLVVYDRQQFQVYNDTNSTLNNALGDLQRTRVSGLAFDAEGNLWVANHSAERPISVLRPDGTWLSFAPSCVALELAQIAIDPFGYKWFVVTNNNAGILVYDDGGTLDDTSDDRCQLISTFNSELPTNKVNCLAVDLDGAVWVGTNEGVVIFECDPFESYCKGTRPIVQLDNFGAYLLEDEDVRTIAVDGANRKWVGTTNGVFVLSPDGLNEEARFDEDNSPLFDDLITDIAINDQTGEVYIGTGKGMLSYRAEAVAGGVVHERNILVYPNPVSPDYEGPIAIKGLARDALVKITDMHGQLVYETKALGGQAIWDGRDYNGRKVQTGVYLIFSTSTNELNPDTAVGRIVLIH